MSDRHIFIDSNVILYLFANDEARKALVKSMLNTEYTVSTQVVNENVSVCLRKLKLSKQEAFAHGSELMRTLQVVNISTTTIASAYNVSTKYDLSLWDSLIIASALESQCTTLYSEDMHDGFVIENKLTIKNPFKGLQ